MNVNQLKGTLKSIIQNEIKHSVIVWSAPGLGKSAIIRGLAEELQMGLIDLRLSQLAPTDLRGLPFVSEQKACWAVPEFLPTENTNPNGGILFLDEINQCSPAMMALAQQLLLEREVGLYKVPSNWFIFSCGNPKSSGAAVNPMPSAVANRLLHFYVKPDLDSFTEYAIKAGFQESIISYLHFKPNNLHNYRSGADAWPSPRSWEMASNLDKIGLSIDAAVGPDIAIEYDAHKRLSSDLPDIDAIFKGQVIPLKNDAPDLMYSLVIALVTRMKSMDDFITALKYLIKTVKSTEWCVHFASCSLSRIQTEFLSDIHKLRKAIDSDKTLGEMIARKKMLEGLVGGK